MCACTRRVLVVTVRVVLAVFGDCVCESGTARSSVAVLFIYSFGHSPKGPPVVNVMSREWIGKLNYRVG